MRTIPFHRIVETVKHLCIEAAHRLPDDVLDAIDRAERAETDPRARHILQRTRENAEIARTDMIPLCQDTGVTVVFVEQGHQVMIASPENDRDLGLPDAIGAGVAKGYEQGFLRKSIVDDPVRLRTNTTTNTPPIIHHTWTAGEQLTLTVMLKGGGCENRSQFTMLTPVDGHDGAENFVVDVVRHAGADACPPLVIGVGIGGNFELACLLAKEALLRPLTSHHPDDFYADMEARLLDRINDLGIGPQGMGGKTTALAVLIKTHPCHIASLPVAVNIDCHSHRHQSVTI